MNTPQSEFPPEVEQAITFFDANYDVLGDWLLTPSEKVTLGGRENKRCRFCGLSAPAVKFSMVAHAIPESLGNRSLVSNYECDACNGLFGRGIENDFGNWTKPSRTFSRIRGKSGVPTLKKGSNGGWRIEYTGAGFEVTAYESDPIFEVDEEKKTATFRLKRDPYTPVAVLKAFVKMGLTLMPEGEVKNFPEALEWIKNPDHQVGLVKDFPILHTFQPGPMPNNYIKAMVLRRKINVVDAPYMMFILAYANEIFQVVLPTPTMDRALDGKQFRMTYFPFPPGMVAPEYGIPWRRQLNLTGREVIKGETTTMAMGFDRMASQT